MERQRVFLLGGAIFVALVACSASAPSTAVPPSTMSDADPNDEEDLEAGSDAATKSKDAGRDAKKTDTSVPPTLPANVDTSYGSGGSTYASLADYGVLTIAVTGEVYAFDSLMPSIVRIRKFAADGSADPNFGSAGVAELTFADVSDYILPSAIALDDANRILIAGRSGPGNSDGVPFVARITASGTRDNAFNSDSNTGGSTGLSDFGELSVNAILPLSGGAFLAEVETPPPSTGGEHVHHLQRFTQAGKPDAAFGSLGRVKIAPMGPFARMSPAKSGVLVYNSGITESTVLKLTASGGVDSAFAGGMVHPGGSAFRPVAAVEVANGAVVVAGFDEVSGSGFVFRYTSAGTLDAAFGVGGTTSGLGGIASMDRLADGRLLLGSCNSTKATVVSVLSADGVLDSSFGTSGRVILPSTGCTGVIRVLQSGKLAYAMQDSNGGAFISWRLNL